jgi:asparagine synthase (glutamine-hydrolysing)
VALGFVRLAILDLSPAGNQPMVASDRAAVMLNGEIYNYVEIREELRERGWTFESTGDAEVLLKGWLEWGEDLLPKLNGMWALAIYDAERDALLLSRDRFGEKPLFWTSWRTGIAFASEVKQLAAFPDVPIRLNRARAGAYLLNGRPYDGASSWFEGIHQVPPSGVLWVDRAGRREDRYWDVASAVRAVRPERDPASWQERFQDAFTRSVKIRLRSDVPVGTSLSAGIDSSAVMATATALGHTGYHSFTLTGDDPRLDEGPEASVFARQMGSIAHLIQASGDDLAACWDRISWHQECPMPSASLFGQWKVLEAARHEGVIVLLDGQGADEILGGYHKFSASLVLSQLRARDLRVIPAAIGFARHLGGPRVVIDNGYRYLGALGRTLDLRAGLRVAPDTGDQAPSVRSDSLTQRLADIERWSLPNLLSYVDRNAMAHSVETRLPFLDPEVATLSLAMPGGVLVRGGWTKWPLRQTLAARGGATPAWRRGKRWFGVPQRDWLRGPLKEHVGTWRSAPHPAWEDLVDPTLVRAAADDWATKRRPRAAWDDRVFELVALDRFLRAWFPT